MQHYEAIFERLMAMLRDEFGAALLGTLVTGSRIHGQPGPTSDLDVHVVIDQPRRRRRNIVLDGIEIELFINPPFQIRRYFDDGGSDLHMFAFGRAIYDPHGLIAALQAEARARWEAGPPPIADRDRWRYRYSPADIVRDLEDVAGIDEAAATLLVARLVDELVATHYQLHRRWLPKPKHRLAELERWDPQVARLARATLAGQSYGARRAASEQLAAHVLAPLGGLMPLEWQNDWEQLQPPTE